MAKKLQAYMQSRNFYPFVLALILLWLLWSGMFKTMLLVLGVISIIIVVYFSLKLNALQYKNQPLFVKPVKLVFYWIWLFIEIVKSNWDVSKRVLSPSLPIKPLLKTVPGIQKTDIGLVIYANSITLTPGTIAINISDTDEVLVHALHEESFEDLEAGGMANRVCVIELDTDTKATDEGAQ